MRTNALLRFGASIALGLALAVPFLTPGFSSLLLSANAQELEAEDLLPQEFGDATGLGDADLQETLGNLINVALGFLGVVAVCIVLFGGFKWMVAGGNDDKVTEAKHMLIAGIIGLAIILSAWAITNFVISSILGATVT